MNFNKNIIKTYQMCIFLRNRYLSNKTLQYFNFKRALVSAKNVNYQIFVRIETYTIPQHAYSTFDSESLIAEAEELVDLYPLLETQSFPELKQSRYLLFNNENDQYINELNKCVSVEEVFTFVRDNSSVLNDKYLTQVVLVLSDLQNMFFYQLEDESGKGEFFKNLHKHKDFYVILSAIKDNISIYDPLLLSYTLFYLSKLGVEVENQFIQDMVIKLRGHILKNFSLDLTARLFKVIFIENSARPYYIAKELVPKVFSTIGTCETVEDLENLSTCLNKLNCFLTDDVLDQFRNEIESFIDKKKLNDSHYSTILKIILLFNYPKWRNRNCWFTSKCILLIKDYIGDLNTTELDILYKVFFKNQEPGEVLNSIQRSSAKMLQQIESHSSREISLRLFSSLIYFSSPTHKTQFRRDLEKFLNENDNFRTLYMMKKIYSYLKISNVTFCDRYWDKVTKLLKEETNFDNIVRLMDNYVFFNTDMDNYRHFGFEHHVMTIIKKYLDLGEISIFPYRLFMCLSFALCYCKNPQLLNTLLTLFRENQNQISATDCLKLSRSLELLTSIYNPIVTNILKQEIKQILRNAMANIYKYNDNPSTCNLLIKSAILRNDYDNELIDDMLISFKELPYMSSKILEGLCFNLFSTDSLIPEVINKCTEYVVHYKDHIMGFNAEKLLTLCYYLNYYPVYPAKFFYTVTDIIIRDQERLSGLGFLHAALALCFFYKLPKSFVKQIFNVEFLDKLDIELANCYFKGFYPQRVRKCLMLLNRAVCLEYPEYNVPWFHQKYIEELQKTEMKGDLKVDIYQKRVRDYLVWVLGKSFILENVIVPYGYHINFVVHFDKHNNPTLNFNDSSTSKLAVLLLKDLHYTRFYTRVKGKVEMKKRHLEILGYKVTTIKHKEWVNLLYSSERVDFIKQVLCL